jgi:hypothetical protein
VARRRRARRHPRRRAHPRRLEVDSRPGEVVAVVSFTEVYAARQHEELDWEHPLGGKAKYLEDPVKRNGPALGQALYRELRREGLL